MADNTGAEYQLNARGTVFSQLHDRMCEVFENGDQQESERLARELLGYADLGDYHKVRQPKTSTIPVVTSGMGKLDGSKEMDRP